MTGLNKINITFDLSLSDHELMRQFKEKLSFQRLANQEKETFRKSGFQKDKLCLYLRLLDANLENIKTSIIAEYFFKSVENIDPDYHGNNRVLGTLKAAKSISIRGWIC